VTRRQPIIEQTRLLDALSQDIISAADEEIRQMHGRKIESTAREVRQLIKDARADSQEGATAVLHDAFCKPGAGPRRAGGFRRPSHQPRH
jgi:hypothetical protein